MRPVLLSLLSLAAAALAGCTATTDFDRPFPPTVADAGVSACADECRAALGCLDDLDRCTGTTFQDPPDQQLFLGYCVRECEATGNGPAFTQCRDGLLDDWADDYGQAFTDLCEAPAPLCDQLCAEDVGTSALSDCLGSVTLPLRGEVVCREFCRRLEGAFWQCAGAATYDTPNAPVCDRLKRCRGSLN